MGLKGLARTCSGKIGFELWVFDKYFMICYGICHHLSSCMAFVYHFCYGICHNFTNKVASLYIPYSFTKKKHWPLRIHTLEPGRNLEDGVFNPKVSCTTSLDGS